MKNGRRKPYTDIGVRRLKCFVEECDNMAGSQWSICADNNLWRPICWECDIKINELVLSFTGDKDKERKMKKYENGLPFTLKP